MMMPAGAMPGMGRGQTPVLVMSHNTERESGRKAQYRNIAAAKAVADIIRTTLGPCSMLKMILDPMGGILMTNDGAAILREIDVTHPAAKSMIELSRAQDEEVGDGTTSVIIIAGQMLHVALPCLERNIHPTVIAGAYRKALDDALAIMNDLASEIQLDNRDELLSVIRSTLGTKMVSRYGDLMCNLALDAVQTVVIDEKEQKTKEIDIKRYVRVEKIPGDEITDSRVLKGVMLNKDVTHAAMRRRVENPRILLLDSPLEYKKGESATNIELMKKTDFREILRLEEKSIRKMCEDIIKLKPDLVFTEKGVSDLAQHFLQRANITAIRRVRKSDNNRIARAVGATIGHAPDLMSESDIGTGCGLFEIRKIGDEYWTFLEDCKNPKACTVVLRGASKDILSEIDRNLADAMNVARNVLLNSRVLPGGGATEMAVSVGLTQRAKSIKGGAARPYQGVADALEIIPRTLIANCGGETMRLLTELRSIHLQNPLSTTGIDGTKGCIADMKDLNVWEPFIVKTQTIKTAIESAVMLLRIDDVVSGMSQKKSGGGGGPQQFDVGDEETFGDERDG